MQGEEGWVQNQGNVSQTQAFKNIPTKLIDTQIQTQFFVPTQGCQTCQHNKVASNGFESITTKVQTSPLNRTAESIANPIITHGRWNSLNDSTGFYSKKSTSPSKSKKLSFLNQSEIDYEKRAQQLMTIEEIKEGLNQSKELLRQMEQIDLKSTRMKNRVGIPPITSPINKNLRLTSPPSVERARRNSVAASPQRRESVSRISQGTNLTEAFKSYVNFKKANVPPIQYNMSYFPQKLMQRPQFKKIYDQNIWQIDLQNICKKKPKQRTKFDRNALAHWISQVPMMSSYAFHIIDSICSKIVIKQFKRGQSIIDGDDSNAPLYIVYDGKRDSDSELLANRKPLLVSKDTFGCHIYDRDYTTRDYFFVPLQPSICFMLSNADYKAIILSQQKINAVSFLNFVKSVTFFKEWQHNKLQAFCGGLYIKNYKRGDGTLQLSFYFLIVVYQQDFPPDNFYIVKSGKFKVQKFVNLDTQNVWPRGVREWEVSKVKRTLSHKINVLQARRFVGERQILMKRDRQVTITADSDNCSMLCMNRTIFRKLLNTQDRKTLLSIQDNMFPTQQQLIMKLTVQNKLKKFKNTAVLNAANTNYHPLGARDFYIQKQRKKLIPWLQGYQDRMRKAKDKFKMANKIQQNSCVTKLNSDGYQKAIKHKNIEIQKIYTGVAELIIKQSTSAIQ